MRGIISPTAGNVENYIKKDSKALDMGVLNTAVPWAMALLYSIVAMAQGTAVFNTPISSAFESFFI